MAARGLVAYLLLGALPLAVALSPRTSAAAPRCRDRTVAVAATAPPGRPEGAPSRRQRRWAEPCQEEEEEDEDGLLDRREAAFALLGSLWAATTTQFGAPAPAAATVGAEARLAFPDPLQGLADRAGRKCLAESLGNRECLVYAGDGAALYGGADAARLRDRLAAARTALAEQLPKLLAARQWSQVAGLLTGPLGELGRTMGQVAGLLAEPDRRAAAERQGQVVKRDLYAVSAAVDRKDAAAAQAAYEAALRDLDAFIQSVS